MKSIVQEASTIAKAIEQAWKTAGSPQDFSVKILEQPIYNFLGLTKRSAKIAFLFESEPKRDVPASKGRQAPRNPYQGPQAQNQGLQNQSQAFQSQPHTQQNSQQTAQPRRGQQNIQPAPREYSQQKPAAAPIQPRPIVRAEGLWNEELAVSARTWLTEVLALMGMQDVTFRTEIQDFNLRIILSRPLIEDPVREKHILASLSTLMIATLKRQFRKALRGHKIVLSHT